MEGRFVDVAKDSAGDDDSGELLLPITSPAHQLLPAGKFFTPQQIQIPNRKISQETHDEDED